MLVKLGVIYIILVVGLSFLSYCVKYFISLKSSVLQSIVA